jgi:hypothetical protein
MMAAVGLSLCAGLGLAGLRERWPARARLIAAAAIGIIAIECWPRPWGQQVPLPVPTFYVQLASEPGPAAVLDLPVGVPGDYASAYQWYQLTHRKPIAWGYLSREYLQHPVAPVRAIIEDRVTDPAAIKQQLVALGYRYVVWHKYATSMFLDRSAKRIVQSNPGAPVLAGTNTFIRAAFRGEQPFLDDALTTVYRLSSGPAGPQ